MGNSVRVIRESDNDRLNAFPSFDNCPNSAKQLRMNAHGAPFATVDELQLHFYLAIVQ